MESEKSRELSFLRRKARSYGILSIFLALAVISLLSLEVFRFVRENARELGLIDIDERAPHYKRIKELMDPLRYSGVGDMLDPDTRLSVDFESGRWILHNVHHFDEDGKVVLRDGRYGLCGDLAAYMYQRISPLMEDDYLIEFVRVAESDFFPAPHGSHIVLKITDRSFSLIPNIYVLDPSFRKYRRIEYFDTYMFYDDGPDLDFYYKKKRDETFPVGIEYPILIKNDYIAGMVMYRVDGKFDKENFSLILSLTRRNRYFSRPVYAIEKRGGVVRILKNEELALKVLGREEFDRLCERLSDFFEGIER
jgi:hypothetical protein